MVPPGWFRLIRAGGFASACVVLSQAGHDLMAPRPAPIWAGWAAVAGVGGVGYLLADRRRSLCWILFAVEVVQVFLHLWFAWSTPAASDLAPAHVGMAMHGGMRMSAPTPHSGGGISLGMLGAHALAGLLVALWLYAGERALWRVLGVLAGFLLGHGTRALLRLIFDGPVAEWRPTGAYGRDGDEPPPVVAVLRHVLVRRGPPPNTAFSS